MAGRIQAFSTEEFQARLRKTQNEMRCRGVDILLIHSPENIYYLTGYQTSGYFAYQTLVVTESAKEPTILVRFIERGNINEYSWLSHYETWKEGDDVVQRTVDIVRKLSGEKAIIGLEKSSWFLTAKVAEELVGKLHPSRFVDVSYLVERIRHVKSPKELNYIRQAGLIAEVEIRAAVAAMRPGITEAEVAAAVFQAGVSAGCEYTGLPHHIVSGHRAGVGHSNWTNKQIVSGELCWFELYGCVERYHATQIRTISVGEPSAEKRRKVELVIRAQDESLAALKPGASSRAVDALVRGPIRAIKPVFPNRSGYSTGIGFPPKTAEWETLDFNDTHDWEVKEGMAFHMLADDGGGFCLSETVVVTANGAERVTPNNERSLIVI
ncbi:Xaa-Pro peptidase family protein [Mesorhizobium sp. WSM3862]|uniref:M24 family metallopeptidase n=1 Tax=Mesorhizobium sp. WSM3862 TaxID=632858 RepID=UPI000BAF3A42|nr:Xaa-Pro peptidase family protein [Mesorhizobium sp. WSM3862]PBB95656.1 hydrolase/peptidase [Mesorhizobium sp. WSM3862]